MSNWEKLRDDKTNLRTVHSYNQRRGSARRFLSVHVSPIYDPATCTLNGSVRNCLPFCRQPHPHQSHRDKYQRRLLKLLPGAERRGHDQQLHLDAGPRHQQQALSAAPWTSSRAPSRSGWGATLEPRRRGAALPLAQNGSKLLNSVHQVNRNRQHLHNRAETGAGARHASASTPSWGQLRRELSIGKRDVVSELGIPGVTPRPPQSWTGRSGDPVTAASLATTPRGLARTRNEAYKFADNLCMISAAGMQFKTQQHHPVGIELHTDGEQFSRGAFNFDGRATGSLNGTVNLGRAGVAPGGLLGSKIKSESAVDPVEFELPRREPRRTASPMCGGWGGA